MAGDASSKSAVDLCDLRIEPTPTCPRTPLMGCPFGAWSQACASQQVACKTGLACPRCKRAASTCKARTPWWEHCCSLLLLTTVLLAVSRVACSNRHLAITQEANTCKWLFEHCHLPLTFMHTGAIVSRLNPFLVPNSRNNCPQVPRAEPPLIRTRKMHWAGGPLHTYMYFVAIQTNTSRMPKNRTPEKH